jgi:hypothetical protein
MPSSPGYKRDYAEEYKTAKARGEVGVGHNSGSAERHRLRRMAIKKGMVKVGDGKDVDHKEPLSKGGSNSDQERTRPVAAHEPRLPAQQRRQHGQNNGPVNK